MIYNVLANLGYLGRGGFRRARVLTSRTGLSLAVGAVAFLIVGTIAAVQWQTASHYGTWNAPADSAHGADQTYATTAQVLKSVKAAEHSQRLPDAVATGLINEDTIHVSPCYDRQRVENPADADFFGECTYGDPNGKKVMVAYGDSHSDMWAAPLMRAAAKTGWQLRVFAKHACPAPDMPFRNPNTKTPDEKCDVFHSTAPVAVQALHPDLVIATSISDWLLADTSSPNPTQWQDGWVATLKKLAQPGTRLAMLGDIPVWSEDGPRCLAAHVSAVQECSVPVSEAAPKHLEAEQAAAAAVGALYIPTMPWICADRCEPVIADNRVYNDDTHLTEAYLKYLTGAVTEALQQLLA
jgi:SGNH domain (fused to AT3 domains)